MINRLNADFSQRVVTRPEDYHWVESPMAGVKRMMLDRIGDEVAHTHSGREEILVLEGTFHDEHGQHPKGSWIRSPHLSEHHPFTKDDGALIYVKTGYLFI